MGKLFVMGKQDTIGEKLILLVVEEVLKTDLHKRASKLSIKNTV